LIFRILLIFFFFKCVGTFPIEVFKKGLINCSLKSLTWKCMNWVAYINKVQFQVDLVKHVWMER